MGVIKNPLPMQKPFHQKCQIIFIIKLLVCIVYILNCANHDPLLIPQEFKFEIYPKANVIEDIFLKT